MRIILGRIKEESIKCICLWALRQKQNKAKQKKHELSKRKN